MAFGLCNAPATFLWLMDSVLTCLAYLNDIIVFAKDWDPEDPRSRAKTTTQEVYTGPSRSGISWPPGVPGRDQAGFQALVSDPGHPATDHGEGHP